LPYAFVAAGFVIFTLCALAATVATLVASGLRFLLPFVWRMWLWSSIGFLIANLAFLAVIYSLLNNVGIAGGAPTTPSPSGVLLVGVVVVGPFVVSALGIAAGAVLGWYLAWLHRCDSTAAV
jgi:hypothetical protein